LHGELGVHYVVDGSVRRNGGRVRISAQLIDAEIGRSIWAERYDCDDSQLFAVQDRITTAVTTAIHQAVEGWNALLTALRLYPRVAEPNVGRLNLIAISYYYEGEYAEAAEAAKRALARYPTAHYPGNVLPWRWLAAWLGQLGRTNEACEALHMATTIDPEAFDRFVHNRVPWHRPEDYEHMLDGLREAVWQG
jgi:tetratricopeptide (TPR) repeat protein